MNALRLVSLPQVRPPFRCGRHFVSVRLGRDEGSSRKKKTKRGPSLLGRSRALIHEGARSVRCLAQLPFSRDIEGSVLGPIDEKTKVDQGLVHITSTPVSSLIPHVQIRQVFKFSNVVTVRKFRFRQCQHCARENTSRVVNRS